MAKRLIQLHIEHVAGVDRPANKRKFLVIKSEVEKKISIVEEDGKYCLYDGDKKMGTYATREAAMAAMNKSEKGALMLTKAQLAKITDEETQKAVLDQQEKIGELEKTVDDQTKEIEKLKAAAPPPDNPDEEAFWKGVSPIVRSRYEAQKKKAEEADSRAKEEKSARDTSAWVEKLKQHTYLPILPDRFAPVMKNVAEACPKEAAEIERVFGAAQEIIAKGAIMFKEIGGNNHGDATSVVARVESMAGEVMKRDNISKADAIALVMREHPDWYQPYRRETQQKI